MEFPTFDLWHLVSSVGQNRPPCGGNRKGFKFFTPDFIGKGLFSVMFSVVFSLMKWERRGKTYDLFSKNKEIREKDRRGFSLQAGHHRRR